MSHNDDLIDEIRQHRMRLRKARLEAEDAELAYREKRKAVRDIEQTIEEIHEEIETGRSGRPIMDHINGKPALDPADIELVTAADATAEGARREAERREMAGAVGRGTVLGDPSGWGDTFGASDAAPLPAPGRADGCGPEQRPDGAVPVEWKSADLDARLIDALGWMGCGSRLATVARDHPWPIDRIPAQEILDAVRNAWANVKASQCEGYSVRGGAAPAFWMGSGVQAYRKPTLEGRELCDRIRRVLPHFAAKLQAQSPSAEAAPAKKSARKGKSAPAAARVE